MAPRNKEREEESHFREFDPKYGLPRRHETFFFSIVSKDRHYWTQHRGGIDNYEPAQYWLSPRLTPAKRKDDPCMVLGTNFPEDVRQQVFGGSDESFWTKVHATMQSRGRASPAITVYCICEDEEALADIAFLFLDIDCRLITLKSTHFFKSPTFVSCMGGHAASLLAAEYFAKQENESKEPTHILLISADIALTYLAMDPDGKYMGSGITPGLAPQFRVLSDHTDDSLPLIEFDEYERLLAEAKCEALPTFAQEQTTAIVSAIFSATKEHCRGIIKRMLDNIDGKPLTVVLSGGDTDFLEIVLGQNQPELVEGKGVADFDGTKFRLLVEPDLAPLGISCLLSATASLDLPVEKDDEVRELLLGQRIAREFQEATYRQGDHVYRGSIVDFERGNAGLESDDVIVRYDDSGIESLGNLEVYDALVKFREVGERETCSYGQSWRKKELADTRQKAEDAAASLKDNSEELHKQLEVRSENEKQGKSPTKQPPPKPSKRQGPKKRPPDYIGKRVAKYFLDNDSGKKALFFGTIKACVQRTDPFLWSISYDDDDKEDFDEHDVKRGILLLEKYKDKDTQLKPDSARNPQTSDAVSELDTTVVGNEGMPINPAPPSSDTANPTMDTDESATGSDRKRKHPSAE